jgi:membrane-associated protein
MQLINAFLMLLFHLNTFLSTFISQYGMLVYLLVFCIIFAETGLFIPVLPGDSLIFACAAFAASGLLNIWIAVAICLISSFLGSSLNYYFGIALGKKLYENSRFIKQEHIDRSVRFYQKHGGKAIIFSRFVPIVRSFTPFVAGIGRMEYKRFMFFNVIGVILWTGIAATLGFFFGNIPIVREHFSTVLIGIIFVSLLPAVIMYLSEKFKPKKSEQE